MGESNILNPFFRVFEPQFLMTPIGQIITRALYSNFTCVYNVGETLYTGDVVTRDINIIYDSCNGDNAKYVQYSPINYHDELILLPKYKEVIENNSTIPNTPICLGITVGIAYPFALSTDTYFIMRWKSEMYNGKTLMRSFFQDIEFKTKKMLDEDLDAYNKIYNLVNKSIEEALCIS